MKSTCRAPHSSRFAGVVGVFLLAVSLLGCGGGNNGTPTPTPNPTPIPTATPTPTPLPPLTGTFDYKGIDYVSWQASEYQGATATDSRQALAATGASWAGVLVTWYMADQHATTIAPGSSTPTEAALIEAIANLHSHNVKVMLKPHVDSNDSVWRGAISPSDVNAWSASYKSYLTHMAQFAKQNNVEMLCIGTELKTMSGAAYSAHWTDLINQIKAEYHGLLTYAANANSLGDEFTSVSFWDQLDLIGLDAYVPLTNKNDPTPQELVAGWSQGPNGNLLAAYRNLASSYGKSVIFTEIGYRSMAGTNRAPWDFSVTAAYDPTEQENCYYAAFAVFLPEHSWMKGIFWWDWAVSPPSALDTDYTPRNKPAGTFLTERYSAT